MVDVHLRSRSKATHARGAFADDAGSWSHDPHAPRLRWDIASAPATAKLEWVRADGGAYLKKITEDDLHQRALAPRRTLLLPRDLHGRWGAPMVGERRYGSLTAAANEVGDSRVFAGVHFNHSCVDGLELGIILADAANNGKSIEEREAAIAAWEKKRMEEVNKIAVVANDHVEGALLADDSELDFSQFSEFLENPEARRGG